MNDKSKIQETIISRVMIMLLGFARLSALTFLYIMPFEKLTLQINYYYKLIEYITMGITFALFIASIVYIKKSKSVDMTFRVITPKMLCLLSASAFGGAVMIPFSGFRNRFSRVALIAYIFLFLAYATYHLVHKTFAYQSVICGIYFIVLKLFGDYYTTNVTFEDKISMSYTTARLLILLLIIIIVLVSYILSRKIKGFVLWHSAAISAVPAVALIVRFFVSDYVILSSLIAICVVFAAIIISHKIIKK